MDILDPRTATPVLGALRRLPHPVTQPRGRAGAFTPLEQASDTGPADPAKEGRGARGTEVRPVCRLLISLGYLFLTPLSEEVLLPRFRDEEVEAHMTFLTPVTQPRSGVQSLVIVRRATTPWVSSLSGACLKCFTCVVSLTCDSIPIWLNTVCVTPILHGAVMPRLM